MNDWSRAASTRSIASAPAAGETFSGNRGLQIEEKLIFEQDSPGHCGVDLPEPAPFASAARRARAARPDRPAGAQRAAGGAPLHPAVAEELCDRQRALSARLVHDEAQPAAQREAGAAAGPRRHPPVAAALDRAGRARTDRYAGALAEDPDRHAGGGPVAGGRRAWRTLRDDDDPRRTRSPRRSAAAGAGAGIGAWHQPGDGGGLRLCGRSDPGQCPRPGRPRRTRSEARPRCRGADADQPQHLRPVRGRDRRDRRGGALRPARSSTATAPISTRSSAGCGRPISASTACTSTCTRPSRPRMAAAGRAAARWRLAASLAPLCAAAVAGAWRGRARARRARARPGPGGRSAGSRGFTARWACSCARSPT